MRSVSHSRKTHKNKTSRNGNSKYNIGAYNTALTCCFADKLPELISWFIAFLCNCISLSAFSSSIRAAVCMCALMCKNKGKQDGKERTSEQTETIRHSYDYGKIDCDHNFIAWEIQMNGRCECVQRRHWMRTEKLCQSQACLNSLVFNPPSGIKFGWTTTVPVVFVSLLDGMLFYRRILVVREHSWHVSDRVSLLSIERNHMYSSMCSFISAPLNQTAGCF